MIELFLDKEGELQLILDSALNKRVETMYAEFGNFLIALRARKAIDFDDDALGNLVKEPSVSVLYHASKKNLRISNSQIYLENIRNLIGENEKIPSIRQNELYLPVEMANKFQITNLGEAEKETVQRFHQTAIQHLGIKWADFISLVNVLTIVVVPGYDDLPFFSGSSSEVWGAIHTCMPSNEAIYVETITHEAAHHWVHLIEDIGPLADDCWAEDAWPSPWRNEPRPLGGVIHGVWVFSAAAVALSSLMLQREKGVTSLSQSIPKRIAFLIAQVELGLEICHSSGLMAKNGLTLLRSAESGLNSIYEFTSSELLMEARSILETRMLNKYSQWRKNGLKLNVN